MEEHAAEAASMAGGEDEDERELSIRGLAAYQPYDGILALKMVSQTIPPPPPPPLIPYDEKK